MPDPAMPDIESPDLESTDPAATGSAPPDVRVVTVFFDSREALPAFLESVRTASTRQLEVVVVDNASRVPLRHDELPDGVRLVRAPSNLGYGGGANLGLADARGEWVVVANPDVVWEPGSLDTVLAHAAAWPRAGAFGPTVLEPDGSAYPSARRFPSIATGVGHALLSRVWPTNPWTRAYRQEGGDPTTDRATDWLSGSCLILRREALADVGGFDEDYFMFFEDVDLGSRLAARGWSSVYVPAARIRHDQGHSWRAKPAAMLRAHHVSAYVYLSRRYPRWYHAPVRLAVRAGLSVRLHVQTAWSQR
ncbi:glycosyltransferase family 2 protein [Miniimonas arenae]|uniref:glycosyltransferase family 2 protein n=1 Tax=Miniimonas arenae TaxID=676201 RepID=UPI0028A5CC7D|nr:glycosyltransferase family 2 protein [Miniimonas arenae]